MPGITVPLHVRDLTYDDLVHCGWTGGPGHVDSVAANMKSGDVDYLAVCTPNDLPIAKGGIRFDVDPGYGELTQLVVFPALQSFGIGSILITALEERIVHKGRDRVELGVETINPRARALYERLGYVACETYECGWDVKDPDGRISRYDTLCIRMRKALTAASPGT